MFRKSTSPQPEKRKKGVLFIVSAPSGAGKTTLCMRIIKTVDNLKMSVSFTTRQPRFGEVNDLDYTFISKQEFQSMIKRKEFVEWAEVHGNLYGTSRKRLNNLLNAGFDVLLDIDTQGAGQIKESCREGVFIFILPPSMKILRERLENRKSNTKEDMEKRLKNALKEIKNYNRYDYVIINSDLKLSVKMLEAVIISERLRSIKIDKNHIKRILI
ncbi:MAG: guanylate kinase [Nitrospirae bacterium GWC2_42_7]|nr:MAG: guanylate kinase [Nitrospirae bacterium GWC2_42_7]